LKYSPAVKSHGVNQSLIHSFTQSLRHPVTQYQIRRSSRSVSGNIAEAFRKRRYPKSFVAKLTDAEGEAAETQVWFDYALACNYIDSETHKKLFDKYEHIISMIMNMEFHPEKWTY